MKKYYRRKYYSSKGPDFIDMLFGAILGFGYIVGLLLFKFFRFIYTKSKPKGVFELSNYNPVSQPPTEKTELVHSQKELEVNTLVQHPESRYGLREGGLLTPAERFFLEILKQIVGDHYCIELQVQLSRIVTPLDSNENFINYKDFNRIKAKSIDFVLYDKEYKPYLAIELDDRTHLRWDRIKRDHFVDQVMNDVGLRILHIPVSYKYDTEKLRMLIMSR